MGKRSKGEGKRQKKIAEKRSACIKSNPFFSIYSGKGPILKQFRSPDKYQMSLETLVPIRLKVSNPKHKMDFSFLVGHKRNVQIMAVWYYTDISYTTCAHSSWIDAFHITAEINSIEFAKFM